VIIFPGKSSLNFLVNVINQSAPDPFVNAPPSSQSISVPSKLFYKTKLDKLIAV
jgi:hypothetical protein